MKSKAWLALAGTILLFSTFEVVSKTITGIPPMQINFLRFLSAGLLLLPFALSEMRGRSIRLSRQDWLRLAALGILNVTLCLMVFQTSIRYIPASAAAVIFCTNPVFVHITEIIRDRRLPGWRALVSLAVSLTGLVLVFLNEFVYGAGAWLGISLAFFAAITYGIFIVAAKSTGERLGTLTSNALSFLIGALVSVPILLVFKVPLFVFDLHFLPHLAYLSIGVTCAAYVLFVYGLRRLPAGAGSLIFFVKPVLSTALAAGLLHESVSPLFLAATAVILAGILLYQTGSPKPTES